MMCSGAHDHESDLRTPIHPDHRTVVRDQRQSTPRLAARIRDEEMLGPEKTRKHGKKGGTPPLPSGGGRVGGATERELFGGG
jgi:hypothetical protein